MVGWLLIGFYSEGEYLQTSYQDWIYHAWRIKTLTLYHKMPSWGHIWSNGINHWRAYQYLQHWLVFLVVQLFHISITKAMLLITITVFIGLRIFIYLFLRIISIQPIIAFVATVLSFAYDQQWIAIKDFSIFISFLIIPFYFYLWVNILNKYPLSTNVNFRERCLAEYSLAFISGSMWILHPVIANVLGGLFFISIGFRAIKIHWSYFLKIVFFYILGAIPFILPYLSADVYYNNPIFSSSIFLRDTVPGKYFGLSAYFLTAIGIICLTVLFFSRNVANWTKIIAMYSGLYFLLIYLAQHDYLPSFIAKLQISRGIPALATLIVFAFAGALNGVLSKGRKSISFGATAIILIAVAIGITEAVKIDTTFTGQPVHKFNEPVSTYFNEKPLPQGSIYVKNVSAASYFGKPGLRFVNSYNEHLLPHPLSLRFSSFMRSEIAYTSIPKAQIQSINDYASALGVEYLVLPETSPLITRLTENNTNKKTSFQLKHKIKTGEGNFALIENTKPIQYAYLVNRDNNLLKWSKNITTPTLQVDSYRDWDDSIHNLATQIRTKKIIPMQPLSFIDTDKLFVPIDDLSTTKDKKILITQSYDTNWKINGSHKAISPSQTRFIVIDPQKISRSDLTTHKGQQGILLYNNWPWWHWPIQFTGITMIITIFILPLFRPKLFFSHKNEQQN